MGSGALRLKKLQQEIKRLRAENARLKNQRGKNSKRRKKVSKPIAPQWVSLIGAGKEIWQDVDVDAYINAERNSWN